MKIRMVALSPIIHGEFVEGIDNGNLKPFRRIPIQHDGRVVSVPVISGNSTRGALRRLLARELIQRFDLASAMGKSFDKFYIAIATGGNLNKTLDKTVNSQRLREIRVMLPPLSVLGAYLYKFNLSGMCRIGFAVPCCAELETGPVSLVDLVADVGLVSYVDQEQAHIPYAKPMLYTQETVIAGTELTLDVDFAPQATEVERACILHGFNLLTAVGGKSGVGFGAVKIDPQDDAAYIKWLKHLTAGDVAKIVDFAESL